MQVSPSATYLPVPEWLSAPCVVPNNGSLEPKRDRGRTLSNRHSLNRPQVSSQRGGDGPWEAVSVRPLLRWLAAGVVGLAVVGTIITAVELVLPGFPAGGRFNPDDEASVLTTYSILLWAATALVFMVLGVLARGSGGPAARYFALGALFTYITFDEGSSFHEQLSPIAESMLGSDDLLIRGWLLLGGVMVIVVGAGLVVLARGIPPKMRRRLVVAATVFLLGAFGMEVVGSLLYTETPADWLLAQGLAPQTISYTIATGIEEGLEMAGALLALRAGLLAVRIERRPGRYALVADVAG